MGVCKREANKNNVIVSWATHQEVNNDYFVIERSKDGSDFEVLGIVEAKEYYAELSTYKFEDNNDAESDLSYYRIQQVDLDGKSTFSDIAKLKIYQKHSFRSYPIPTANVLTIDTDNPQKFTLMDANGMALKSLNVEETQTFNLTQYPSGIYYIMDNCGNFERIQKYRFGVSLRKA